MRWRSGRDAEGGPHHGAGDSRVDGGGQAIKVLGDGDLTIKRSVVRGGEAAVVVTGNGTVGASKSRFSGRIVKKGDGDFDDEGGNTFGK